MGLKKGQTVEIQVGRFNRKDVFVKAKILKLTRSEITCLILEDSKFLAKGIELTDDLRSLTQAGHIKSI